MSFGRLASQRGKRLGSDGAKGGAERTLAEIITALSKLNPEEEAVFPALAHWDGKNFRLTIPKEVARILGLEPKEPLLVYVRRLDRKITAEDLAELFAEG